MDKRYENKTIISLPEYNKAIDAILGDKNPKNCESTVVVYAMFARIARWITESKRYDVMNAVDKAKIDDSIECIDTVLKGIIGDETFNYAILSHLGMLDDDATSDDVDAESEDGSDEDSDDDCESESQFSDYYVDDDGVSKSDDDPSEDAAEKDNEPTDIESIDMFKVWHVCRTTNFNDFDGYISLAAIGRRHGFDSGYVAEQLLYIAHNYSIGFDKIHYIGAAITANSVQEAFEKDPKAGDLVYFAYCEKPTFVMYSNMSGNQRYIIYQLDKETSAILEIYDKPDLKSACDFLNDINVDKTAFSNGFNDLKSLCHNHEIDFNLVYRRILKCYMQESNIEIDHVSNIKFYITKKFDTRDEYRRYAKNNGSDGDMFLIDNRPTREYSNRNNGWVMILGLIVGCCGYKTKKLLQVNVMKIADRGETLVSIGPTIDTSIELDDTIDTGDMKYMSNDDIAKQMKSDHDEFIKKMKHSQMRRNSTKRSNENKSSTTNDNDEDYNEMMRRLNENQ